MAQLSDTMVIPSLKAHTGLAYLTDYCYCLTCVSVVLVCSQMESLVGQEVGRLLARCGLAEVVERVRLYKVGGTAQPAPWLDGLIVTVTGQCCITDALGRD